MQYGQVTSAPTAAAIPSCFGSCAAGSSVTGARMKAAISSFVITRLIL